MVAARPLVSVKFPSSLRVEKYLLTRMMPVSRDSDTNSQQPTRASVAAKAAEALSTDGLDAARAAARAEAERAKSEKAQKRAQSRKAKKAKARAQREAKAPAPQETYSLDLHTLAIKRWHCQRELLSVATDVMNLERNLEGRAFRLINEIDRYRSFQREAIELGMHGPANEDKDKIHEDIQHSARLAITALKKLLNHVGADTADISESTPDECRRSAQVDGYVTDSDEGHEEQYDPNSPYGW